MTDETPGLAEVHRVLAEIAVRRGVPAEASPVSESDRIHRDGNVREAGRG